MEIEKEGLQNAKKQTQSMLEDRQKELENVKSRLADEQDAHDALKDSCKRLEKEMKKEKEKV